jgi:hypothetical protein
MKSGFFCAALVGLLGSVGHAHADFVTGSVTGSGIIGSAGGDDPLFNFTYSDPYGNSGYGQLSTVPSGFGDGSFWATSGTLILTQSSDHNASVGTYSLLAEGPGPAISPSGLFAVDNLIYPGNNAAGGHNNSGTYGVGIISGPSELTIYGLVFGQPGTGSQSEINIWGVGNDSYALWSEANGSYNIQISSGGSFTLTANPEPASLTLLGLGLACVAGYTWRRRKKAAPPAP